MRSAKAEKIWNVSLPWSDGSLSACAWQKGARTVVSVPELDILCTGSSQSEAVFRLFGILVKYYRELEQKPAPLSVKDIYHMKLLSKWMQSVERKMVNEKELVLVR